MPLQTRRRGSLWPQRLRKAVAVRNAFILIFFFCVCRYFCSVPQTLAGQKGNLCVCVGEATLKAQKPVNQEKAPSRGAVEAGSPRAGADSLMAPPQLYFGFFWRGGGNNLCCFSPSRLWRVFF